MGTKQTAYLAFEPSAFISCWVEKDSYFRSCLLSFKTVLFYKKLDMEDWWWMPITSSKKAETGGFYAGNQAGSPLIYFQQQSIKILGMDLVLGRSQLSLYLLIAFLLLFFLILTSLFLFLLFYYFVRMNPGCFHQILLTETCLWAWNFVCLSLMFSKTQAQKVILTSSSPLPLS